MSESDLDEAFVGLLWLVKGGKILVRRNGVDVISIGRVDSDPAVDIMDINSVESMMPSINPVFMERMRKLSRKLASSNRNVVLTVNRDLFLNFGSKGTIFKDVEGFANLLVKRIGQLLKGRDSR